LIKSQWKTKLLFIIVALSIIPMMSGCSAEQDFDERLVTITEPYRFNIGQWEFRTVLGEFGEFLSGGNEITDNATSAAATYFSNVEQIKRLEWQIKAVKAGSRQGDLTALEEEYDELRQKNAELVDDVERLLESQIREALSEQGIYNPLHEYIRFNVHFPPVNFKMEKPPHLLVISPRDRIESIREVALLPEMTIEEMESIEAALDSDYVSSLVVELGGMATYPSFVTDLADVRFILDTIGEEWLHQYLTFTPLGFYYVLDLAGIRPDYEIATINETVASMVSKEIGGAVYAKYYAQNEEDEAASGETESGFDFNREMREIRKAVDDYLERGEIEQAEEFMEQKRQYLAEHGYHIRKLNQAYFAFHGTYADSPTSISPIGVELKKLRSQSESLSDFLEDVTGITSRQDLAEKLQ